MFDAYRIERLLRGRLGADDKLETLARDSATGAFWVLTGRELVVIDGDDITHRIDRDQLRGERDESDVGHVFRVHTTERGVVVGTFRKTSRFTTTLGSALSDASGR